MKRNLLALALVSTLLGVSPGFAQEPYAVHVSESAFEDVMDSLKLAIQDRGMYINNIMHMGEMLERTGKDLGIGGPVYLKAESIEFCSALLSRKMTTENPARIVNCPFIISAYVLPDEPDKTYIVYKRLPAEDQSEVMNSVREMLDGVAQAAASGW